MGMTREISVLFPEDVWQAIMHYEPLAPGTRLTEPTRRRLHDATAIGHPEPVERRGRVVTVSIEQADALEAWLGAAAHRSGAPAAVGSAARYIQEARRLAL
jgi:hypothetical protein